jgi:hypothetical protein
VVVSFIGGWNRSTRKKPPTCCKSLTNLMLYQVYLAVSGKYMKSHANQIHTWLNSKAIHI